MAVLRSLLALYGAFDQVATQTQDPEMRAMVEKILPGTTGPDQRGWYKEIQDFVRRNAPTESVEFPSAQEAMQELTGGAGFEGVPAQLSSRDVGRLFQATMGLGILKESQPTRSTPIPVLQQIDRGMLNTVFALAATPMGLGPRFSPETPSSEPPSSEPPSSEPPPPPPPPPPPAGITSDQIPEMLDIFREQGLDGWKPFIEAAAQGNQVAHDVAAIPPMKAIGTTIGPEVRTQITDENGAPREVTDQGKVTSEVIQVDGTLAVLLTTEFTRTPWDINKVTEIITPLNWDNANKFFAKMTSTGPTADGRASQVLEEVSTDPGLYTIKTHLKYVKEERPGDNFVINYDFADRRGVDDSRQVHVDSGYILLSPTTDGAGVRVLTSKMVAMDGLSPTAVAIFAHAMGWLSIGEMMMFGDPVASQDDPIVRWTTAPDPASVLSDARSAPMTGPDQQPSSPQPVSQILVKETTKAVAEYVNVATKETAVIADKWIKGDLSVQDMIDHTTKLGGKLFSEPFRILDTMMKNAASRPGGTPDDQAGGGGSQ